MSIVKQVVTPNLAFLNRQNVTCSPNNKYLSKVASTHSLSVLGVSYIKDHRC